MILWRLLWPFLWTPSTPQLILLWRTYLNNFTGKIRWNDSDIKKRPNMFGLVDSMHSPFGQCTTICIGKDLVIINVIRVAREKWKSYTYLGWPLSLCISLPWMLNTFLFWSLCPAGHIEKCKVSTLEKWAYAGGSCLGRNVLEKLETSWTCKQALLSKVRSSQVPQPKLQVSWRIWKVGRCQHKLDAAGCLGGIVLMGGGANVESASRCQKRWWYWANMIDHKVEGHNNIMLISSHSTRLSHPWIWYIAYIIGTADELYM